MDDVELLDFHMSARDDRRAPTSTSTSFWLSAAAVVAGRDEAAAAAAAGRGHLLGIQLSPSLSTQSDGELGLDYSDWPTVPLDDGDLSHIKYPGEFRHIPPWEYAVKVRSRVKLTWLPSLGAK
jgi:hypothetical protein